MAFLGKKTHKFSSTLNLCSIFCTFVTLSFYFSLSAHAGFKPDQIKAAYIYNLPNFVYWHDDKQANTHITNNKAFVIKILGSESIARYLSILTRGETIKGQPITVDFITSLEEATDCSILFIDKSYENKLPSEVLSNLAERGILTVGESLGFLKKGGMVGLVPIGKRIMILINPSMAQKARLAFSAKLMKVAKVFDPQKNEGDGE